MSDTYEAAIAYFEGRVAWAARMEASHRGDAVGRYATELHEYAELALAALRGQADVEQLRAENEKLRAELARAKEASGGKTAALAKGSTVFYVDRVTGQIDRGEVFDIYSKNGKVQLFRVDFQESGNFDEFLGSAWGTCIFGSEEEARAALSQERDAP